MGIAVAITVSGTEQIDKQLSRLSVWERGEVLLSALEDGAKVVARRASELAPRGGSRTGRKRGVPHLADAISTTRRRYKTTQMAVVGPVYRRVTGANHGHLVEKGHRIATKKSGPIKDKKSDQSSASFVKPNPFLEPAVNDTRGQVEAAVIRGVIAAVDKALGSG